jgi:uncharacterized protein YlxP (DUF503 family)
VFWIYIYFTIIKIFAPAKLRTKRAVIGIIIAKLKMVYPAARPVLPD